MYKSAATAVENTMYMCVYALILVNYFIGKTGACTNAHAHAQIQENIGKNAVYRTHSRKHSQGNHSVLY